MQRHFISRYFKRLFFKKSGIFIPLLITYIWFLLLPPPPCYAEEISIQKRNRWGAENACKTFQIMEGKNSFTLRGIEETLKACYWCHLLKKYEGVPFKKRQKLLNRCLNLAKETLKKYRKNPVIGFWTAVFEGILIGEKGVSWEAMRYAREWQKLMKNAMQQIPDYYYSGPYRMWGKALIYVPGFLLSAMGESLGHARELLEKAVERHPDYLMNKVYLADVCRKLGDYSAAEKLYRDVINTPPDVLPEVKNDNIVAIEKAREKLNLLLEKMKR